MQPKPYERTPEQIALAEERKARKQRQVQPAPATNPGSIINRSWITLEGPQDAGVELQRIKVLTWNSKQLKLLAQCLIRRDLFPTSNCLKAGQREHMIYSEILAPAADIICLQEVDRLEKLLPILEGAGYSHHFAAGPRKKHGCLIAYKQELYSKTSTKMIQYDEEHIRSEGSEDGRRGRSFQTRNIGSIVSLRSKVKDGEGVVVATTHLFWHPKYTYERTRQVGILVREVSKFRSQHEVDHWPCIISGDFNFDPNDPAYSLIVGDSLLPMQEDQLSFSRVVHVSVDPRVPTSTKLSTDDEDGGDSTTDPDKVITNARSALPEDGLLTSAEFSAFFDGFARLRSVYDEGLRKHRVAGANVPTFGDRATLNSGRQGAYEPEYTSYTHYWKTVLDYIFVLDPVGRQSSVVGFLTPHRTVDLVPGLPQKGICGSDHMSLSAELCWVDKLGSQDP